MLNVAELCTRAGAAMLEAQLAGFQAYTHALFDGGSAYAQHNMDAFRTTLASGTVAARQLMAATADHTA